MTIPSPPGLTRRGALCAAAAALAWRPGFAQDNPGNRADPAAAALHALNRVGNGPAPGDLERVTRIGAEAWIAEQLSPDGPPLPAPLFAQLASLETLTMTQRDLASRYRELTQANKQAKAAEAAGKPAAAASTPAESEFQDRRNLVQRIHYEAAESRLLRALASPRQLEERMVDFWFNHFNVFEGKGLDRVLVGAYERQAIRPNVFGRFRTLLGATARHPAMLFYLDNWLSVAPGYQPRRGGDKGPSGLNENYARELMELHTLGVDGGYTQHDVTELARMLTGWTIDNRGPATRRRGGRGQVEAGAGHPDALFVFQPERHDDGNKTWLGHAVAPAGQAEGEFALDVLARHPATARRIATRLAQHFVADAPPPALVDALAHRFLATDGDIRAVLQTLFASREFRAPAPGATKFKTPYEFVVSATRATGIAPANVRPLLAALTQMGQPLFGCQTPDGYKDTEAAWLNPGAITQRVNFATALASGRLPLLRADDAADPQALGAHAMERQSERAALKGSAVAGSTPPVDEGALLATLGPAISEATRATIARAEPGLRAAMVLGGPDFMRH